MCSFLLRSCKSEQNGKNVMTVSEFMKFVDGQRDSRLNEILFPFCNAEKAQELITKYEPNQFNVKVRKIQGSRYVLVLFGLRFTWPNVEKNLLILAQPSQH